MRLRNQHKPHRVQTPSGSNNVSTQRRPALPEETVRLDPEQHPVLARHLKKLGLTAEQPPSPEAWQQFLAHVNRAYQDAEQDHYLLEQSLTISSREMQDLIQRKQAEATLQESEQRFRDLFEGSPDPIFVEDYDGYVLDANPAACTLHGIPREQLIGCHVTDLVPAEQREQVEQEFADLVSGAVHRLEGSSRRQDGRAVPIELRVNYIVYDGQPALLLHVYNITERKRAEEALRESEKRHRSLLEHLPVGVYRTSPEGRFLEANAATARLLGVEEEAALYQLDIKDLYVDPTDRERHIHQLDRQRGVIEEFQLQRLNGETIWVRDYSQAQRNDAGAVLFYDGILLDITEQKQAQEALQESERRYRTLIEHAVEAIVVVDVETGRFIDSNANAAALYGLSREALHQTGPAALSPERQPDGRLSVEAAREEINRAAEGDVRIFEWMHRNSEGHEIPCEIRLVRIPSSDRLIVRGSVTNIAERKQAEQKLIEAREKAEEISRLKSTFLNNMSHEIRTPLTAIIGFSAILAEETSLEQRELVDLIEQSGKRLLNTLNTVLDLSMLESGSLSLENDWFDLVEAAQEKVMEMQPFAWEKNIDLSLATSVRRMPVYLDRAFLDRILTHLIDNAIKFTPKGVVTVALSQAAGRVHLYVKDTGVGISEAFQPYLFDDFKQESTGLTRSHDGVGLGLAVTRRMIDLMGGTIAVESNKGQGSLFNVSFAQPLMLNGKKTADPGVHPSKPFILVVEDTPEIEMLVEYMLSDFYEVVTVSHEEAALTLAQDRRFDLVLMDINLGSTRTGVDVMKALRELPDYQDVPIVAMTAYALLEDRTRFLQAGFDGYLSKPFSVQQAQDTIGHLLAVDGRA